MRKYVRYSLLIIVVLAALMSADYFIVKQNPDVLEYSMQTLGEKLVAMVPEGKEAVKNLFDQFASQVHAKEVSPEQVELVAANILNLTNQNASLTAEEAESVLSFTLYSPDSDEWVTADSIGADSRIKLPRVRPRFRPPRKPIEAPHLKALGERLKMAFEYNDKVLEAIKDKQEIRRHFHFQIEDGLKLALDPDLKKAFGDGKFKEFELEFKVLKNQEMLVWQENLAVEMQERMERRHKELEEIVELRELKGMERLEKLHELQALKSLESLKNLEKLGFIPNFDSDSLHVIIQTRIKQSIEQERK